MTCRSLLWPQTRPASAQSGGAVTDVNVQYTFGKEINFSARIQSSHARRI